MNWRVVLTLLLLAAALLSGWAVWRGRASGEQAHAPTGRSDYVLHDFAVTALDREGKESFSMRAPLLRETPGKRTIDIDAPRFQIPDKDGKYWAVRSRTGWVSQDNKEIRLRGDVVVDSPPGDPRPTTVNTQQLNAFPDTHRVTSDAEVAIEQPGLTMRGLGLDADLSMKRFTLKSQARTRYVSTRR